jgi:hypothetical protein
MILIKRTCIYCKNDFLSTVSTEQVCKSCIRRANLR